MGDEPPNTFGVKLKKRADGGEHKKRSPKGNDEKAKAEAEAKARADSEAAPAAAAAAAEQASVEAAATDAAAAEEAAAADKAAAVTTASEKTRAAEEAAVADAVAAAEAFAPKLGPEELAEATALAAQEAAFAAEETAAAEMIALAKAANCEIVLPTDAVAAQDFKSHAASRVVSVDDVAADEMILDMGPRSADAVVAILKTCKTLVWNGPFGAFELQPFDAGTNAVAKAAADLTRAGALVTVAGGGDTVSALNQSGAADNFTYISTAGGAFLEWLEGKVLPGVEALRVK
jgi:hypothetical protein